MAQARFVMPAVKVRATASVPVLVAIEASFRRPARGARRARRSGTGFPGRRDALLGAEDAFEGGVDAGTQAADGGC